jgi:metacaspase-1
VDHYWFDQTKAFGSESRLAQRESMVSQQSEIEEAAINDFQKFLASTKLPDKVKRKAIELVAELHVAFPGPSPEPGAATGNRRLVYVHGICAHSAGYSNSWWQALAPYVQGAFGAGVLGSTRLEVLWSDVVAPSPAAGVIGLAPPEQAQAAAEIREALRDRLDRHAVDVGPQHLEQGLGPPQFADPLGMLTIPGLECIDDFASYLSNDAIRRAIIDRFTRVVTPLLDAGFEIDIISHSWGTVVAYEGLRQLEDSGQIAPHVRNLFTVGAALSIGPVKQRLLPANQDGHRPAMVRRWVNLNAQGDIVGGPLAGRPYEVDDDFPNLTPIPCGNLLGIVNPICAHSSYFQPANVITNRDIFGAYISQP